MSEAPLWYPGEGKGVRFLELHSSIIYHILNLKGGDDTMSTINHLFDQPIVHQGPPVPLPDSFPASLDPERTRKTMGNILSEHRQQQALQARHNRLGHMIIVELPQ